MHLIAAVTFVILHVVTEQRVRWDKVDYMHWLGVVELGLAISLGYSWWDEAMNKGSPQQIAVLANFIPLLSTLWLVIFGGQLLTTQLAVAAMLIIGGSYLSVSAARRPN